jgi:HEAT repeat protein
MWKRYGELTPEGVSGTEGEFWKAYTSWISNKKPLPLFIFNQTPYTLSSQDELSQLNKVIDFKNKIKDKVFIGHYPNSEQFADIVRPILIEKIFDLTIGNGSSEKDKSKIDPLIGALKDKDMQVQNYAIDTLDIFNTDYILPSLITALNDKNPNVRKNVASTLGNKGDKRAVMPLIGLINDPDKTVRRNVVQALGNLCDNRAVPQLIKSLEDKDKTVRRRAALALGKIGDIQAFESLIKALNKEQKSNRVFAIRALSMLRDRRAINYLLPYLDDDNDYFRKVIADAIIHIDPSYQYAINKMLKSNDQFIVSTSLNPITLKLSADPNTILVGGDKSIIIAQLYYNKQPYMMPNVQIKLSLNNNAIATLLKTKSLLTDKNGRVEISLSSNDISGHVISVRMQFWKIILK